MRKTHLMIIFVIGIVSLLWFFQSVTLNNTFNDKIIGIGETSQLSKEETFRWIHEQDRRKEFIKRGCKTLGLSKEEELKMLMKNTTASFHHLLVDDERNAIYCYIPKVACTNWKKIWMVLTGLTTEMNLTAINSTAAHVLQEEMEIMNKTEDSEVLNKIETYRKFIVVRHPFQRLASAYRNKIEGSSNYYQPFFPEIVLPYVKDQRPDANLTNILWPEFVDFLTLGEGEKTNEHWESYESMCHPCAIDYDVIGKIETIVEDSEMFLRLIDAPRDLHFPSKNYKSSDRPERIDTSSWRDYQKQLRSDQISALHKTYSKDLMLFGFT